MSVSKPFHFSIIFYSFLFCFIIINKVNAQKRDNVQTNSYRVSNNVVIDGKTTEWKDFFFKTYNKHNQIFYTIGNDDNKLYLFVKAPAPITVDKLITGGLTLTVSHNLSAKRKNDKNNKSITFPVHEYTYSETIQGPWAYQAFKSDTIGNKRQIDSLMHVYNKKATSMLNQIALKGINDTISSTNNNYGIEAAIQFTNKMELIYELAVPLNYLGLDIKNLTQFSYNIKLNGYPLAVKRKPSLFPSPIVKIASDAPVDFDYLFLNSVSDVWGKYTLANK
ncbi:MAG TPA: hypothetical protein VIQ77_00950 [Mucilaginibacter sp.]|jgi:hypothetical protein